MAYSESGYESDIQSAESTSTSVSESAESASPSSDTESIKVGESADRPSRGDNRYRTRVWRDDGSSRTPYATDSDWNDRYQREHATTNYGPLWSLRQFFRRLFGQPEEALPGNADAAAGHLAALARESLGLHPHYGNQSVAHVAERMGFAELGGNMAYEQVDHMLRNWSTLANARTAQDRANAGGLVVAGSAGATQAHTAIVTPGPGATTPDGAFYPNVACGGLGGRRSDGSRTVADVWPPSERGSVQYFVPR